MPNVVQSIGANSAVAVTPSATTVYDQNGGGQLDALYIGGAGNVYVVDSHGNTVLFSGVPAGTILPLQCKQVLATSTTATLIVGLRYG